MMLSTRLVISTSLLHIFIVFNFYIFLMGTQLGDFLPTGRTSAHPQLRKMSTASLNAAPSGDCLMAPERGESRTGNTCVTHRTIASIFHFGLPPPVDNHSHFQVLILKNKSMNAIVLWIIVIQHFFDTIWCGLFIISLNLEWLYIVLIPFYGFYLI